MAETAIDTGAGELIASLDAGVLTLTLNRPEARNAMSGEMNQALGAQLAAAEVDPEVKVLVLTGAGQGFCAGGDVKGMDRNNAATGGETTLDEQIATQRLNQRATAGKLFTIPKPTIAALPGAAAGAGLALALACDIRIAAESAIMATGYARIGLTGDYGVAWLLTRLVGTSRARELLFLSERIDARRCETLGLVNRVVPDADLREAAFALAKSLAEGPSIALACIKDNLDHAVTSRPRSSRSH